MAARPNEAALLAALDRGEARLFLIYGPQEGEVDRITRALLARALGTDGERVDLTGAVLKADPARLVDEAAAISLFGGRRAIRLVLAREDVEEPVAALLDAPGADTPVIVSGSGLNGASRLVKLVSGHRQGRVLECKKLDAAAVVDAVLAAGRDQGLRIDRAVAAHIAKISGQDRVLARLEVEKYALFLDAAPDRPATLDDTAIALLSAAHDEQDLFAVAAAALAGDAGRMAADLARTRANGLADIAILRAVMRRVQAATKAAAVLAGGGSRSSAEGFLWGVNKADAAATITAWSPAALARANARLIAVEAGLMGAQPTAVLDMELLMIARQAAQGRERGGR